MSYIDSALSENGNQVLVWERDSKGNLVIKKYKAPYYCYIKDKNNQNVNQSKLMPKSLFGDNLIKREFNNRWSLKEFVKSNPGITFESDISPELKVLAENYYRKKAPEFNLTFFDIETDADLQARGWPTMDDPYGEIMSVSIYHQWLDSTILITVPPWKAGLNPEQTIGELPTAKELGCEHVIYCDNEEELLTYFLRFTKDSDILSGWNSDKYDVPYVVERLKFYLSEEEALSALCREGMQAITKQVKMMFSDKKEIMYKLVGRASLDYMMVYKKFTFMEQPSYSLENIAQFELGYGKVEYSGNLPALYRNDYKKFLIYNIHDTNLLRDLDKKLQFFSLLNDMAHDCTCRLNDVLGTVAMTDQAFMAWAHHERNQVIPDCGADYGVPKYISHSGDFDLWLVRQRSKNKKPVSIRTHDATYFIGAYVHELVDASKGINKRGIHGYTGSTDINSLYPNVIIALNISPETVTPHANPKEHLLWPQQMNTVWRENREKEALEEARKDGIVIQENDNIVEVQCTKTKKAKYERLNAGAWDRDYDNAPFVWGARKDIVGLVPEVLAYWYEQRLIMKEKMVQAYEAGDKELAAYYERLQHVKKIQLNSAYGALGNKYSHFFNLAYAECTTLGGQGITKHMMSQIGLVQDNLYDLNADSIIYGDTDSCYFKIHHVENDKEAIIYADHISDLVSGSFKKYMIDNHNCDEERALRIQAGREIVGDKSLFVDKKRYAIHVIDDEGKSVDKVKVMGLEVKQSSTPIKVQKFLDDILKSILRGDGERELEDIIQQFRADFFNKLSIGEFGMPKGLKGIEDYVDRLQKRALMDRSNRVKAGSIIEEDTLNTHEERVITKLKNNRTKDDKERTRWQLIADGNKIKVPGHVQASINWNKMLDIKNEYTRDRIVSGMKIRIYYLEPNSWGFESIAIPTDEPNMPKWFEELPFDLKKMSEVLIDMKLKATYKAIGWAIPKHGVSIAQSEGLFEF